MTLRVAIVADDLTGALDTAAPFAAAGLPTVVAVDGDGVAAALARGAAVVAVNTASRGLGEAEAAARAGRAAALLAAAGPAVMLKKIDSRLKGHPGAEAGAVAAAAGRHRLVVAPAVPDQGRWVRDGAVIGRGVAAPLAVAPLFAGVGAPVVVAETETDADLDTLVACMDWGETLAVGARGLGSAFARHFAGAAPPAAAPPAAAAGRILFAFGSRDPITAAQIDTLTAERAVAGPVEAPGGRFDPAAVARLPAVVRCAGAMEGDPAAVAARFGAAVAAAIRLTRPDLAVVGGGDTALAVLAALGVAVVAPRGELAPGIPWFEMATADGQALAFSVKSGGFGDLRSLSALVPAPAAGVGGGKAKAGASS